MHLFATVGITSGHNTLADVLFLAAFIVAVIGFILSVPPRSILPMLGFAIAALVSLAWFVL